MPTLTSAAHTPTLVYSSSDVVDRLTELETWRARFAPGIVGRSDALVEALTILRGVAGAPAPVVLQGETGTGKELFARALHDASPRARGAFVAINCAALPDSLIESELFGHAKGSFTGAAGARDGLIASANGGTLFLDEIGELPASAQAKLLRVLQERKLRPIGSDRTVDVDVRIVVATHRDLEEMVEQGTFRADLYHRLAVMFIDLPPLRERTEDIPLLVEHFLREHSARCDLQVSGIGLAALEHLSQQPWTGNVRELGNVIERALLLQGTNGRLDAEHVARALAPRRRKPVVQTAVVTGEQARPANEDDVLNLKEAVVRLERRLINVALERSSGNRTEAAALLGLNRTTLVEKLRRIDGDGDRQA